MPHLSPMNWLTAPIIFTLLSTPMIMSSLWWTQAPKFPTINCSPKAKLSTMWNWN